MRFEKVKYSVDGEFFMRNVTSINKLNLNTNIHYIRHGRGGVRRARLGFGRRRYLIDKKSFIGLSPGLFRLLLIVQVLDFDIANVN